MADTDDWTQTQEGQNLNDAWNTLVGFYTEYLPSMVDNYATLAADTL